MTAIISERRGNPAAASTVEICGSVARPIFVPEDPDDAYCVFALSDGTTVQGRFPFQNFRSSLVYRFMGRWSDNTRYGRQFAAETFTVSNPASKSSVVAYLAAFAPRVGPKRAAALWESFGADAIKTLRENPNAVAMAGTLSLDDAHEAAYSLAQIADMEQTRVELFGMLNGRGFPGKLTDRAIAKWGAAAASRIRRNPYTLLINDMPGAGFKRCDKLWCDLGMRRDALKRQMVKAWDIVKNDRDGNTWVKADVLARSIRDEIVSDKIDAPKALKLGVRARWLAKRRDADGVLWIAEAARASAERRIADAIVDLRIGPVLWPADLPVSASEGDGLPSAHQREMGLAAMAGPVGVLVGGPGTGKSHTLAFILREIIRRYGAACVAVCAPTGKAAVRSTQMIQRLGIDLKATTIHRLLKIVKNGHGTSDWGFESKRGSPLPHRFIIVDECSMIDASLMASFLEALQPPSVIDAHPEIRIPPGAPIPPKCKRCGRALTNPESWKIGHGPECKRRVPESEYEELTPETSEGEIIIPTTEAISLPGAHVLLIGDPRQLPPVGHGAPFRDIIESAAVGCGELSEVRRNAGQIVHACRAICTGDDWSTSPTVDLAAGVNLRMVECRTDTQAVESLERLVRNMRSFNPIWETQVITPMNSRSKVSREPLNLILQGILNATGKQAKGNPFRVGDKIICLKNGWNQSVEIDGRREGWKANAEAAQVGTIGGVVRTRPAAPDDPSSYAIVRDADGPVEAYIANGEIGKALAVGDGVTIAEFDSGIVKIFMGKAKGNSDGSDNGGGDGERGSGCNFDLAYAITIHKAQGSESPCVIFMIDEAAGMLASRELIYTAISRASKLCVLIGRESIVKMQARKASLVRRKTFLKEMLNGKV